MFFAGVPWLKMLWCKCRDPWDAKAESLGWRKYKCLIVRNPLYWFAHIPTVALIVVGRRLHSLFGQHLPLREHGEKEIEHAVRVWWIYPSDAAFASGLLLVAYDLVVYLMRRELAQRFYWSKLVLSTAIYASYVLSNVAFLHAMRRRHALRVRCFIAGNAALAIGMLIMLIVTAYRIHLGALQPSVVHAAKGHSWLYEAGTWTLRVGFVGFLLTMAATYARLWTTYDAEDGVPLREEARDREHGANKPPQNGAGETSAAAHQAGAASSPSHLELAVGRDSRAGSAAAVPGSSRQVGPCVSFVAAFFAATLVFGLLLSAACLNSEGLWEALA